MKLDLTKLPVLEMIVGFLLLAIALTFVGAFAATGGGSGGEAVSTSPTPTPGESPCSTPSPGGQAVHLKDNKFECDKLNVTAGASVTFDITNDGKAVHNMHIAGPDGEYDTGDDAKSEPDAIRAGKTATLKWTAPGGSGEIKFQCDFHPAEMKGTITVH